MRKHKQLIWRMLLFNAVIKNPIHMLKLYKKKRSKRIKVHRSRPSTHYTFIWHTKSECAKIEKTALIENWPTIICFFSIMRMSTRWRKIKSHIKQQQIWSEAWWDNKGKSSCRKESLTRTKSMCPTNEKNIGVTVFKFTID